MKIGILTFQNADNYGAVLQVFALQKTIEKHKENACVEIINYDPSYIKDEYKLINFNFSTPVRALKSFAKTFIYLPVKIKVKSKFKRFRDQYLSISTSSFNKIEFNSGYDSVIVGSDQVWNSEITKHDDVFFLSFLPNEIKKISYAASLGKNTLSDKDQQFIADNIDNFDYISVRESSAVNKLQDISNKTIKRVLDPTFLLNKDIWNNLCGLNQIDDKYILLYIVSMNDEAMKIAEHLSKKTGLPVWYINTSYKKNRYGFKHIRNVGPLDFLKLFKNAEFVVTTSFHGTAFSIIFEKVFFTIPYELTSSRMTDLLKLFNLESRIVTIKNLENDDVPLKIDYYEVNKIVDREKETSLNFLLRAME